MPLPARPHHPLIDDQEWLVSHIKALETALEQARGRLKRSVETASQVLSPDELEAWATYLYWCRDERVDLAWLAQALTGDPVYQSLKGRFTPITTGICCAFCKTPLVFASQGALFGTKEEIDKGAAVYCSACHPNRTFYGEGVVGKPEPNPTEVPRSRFRAARR